VVIACVLALAAPMARAKTLPPSFVDTTEISGLVEPTAVRFSPTGEVFIAEKAGVLKRFAPLPDPGPGTVVLDLRGKTLDYHDRGLLSFALDPGFPLVPYVYVLYTYDGPPGQPAPVWRDSCGFNGQPSPTDPGGGCVASGRLSRYTMRSGAFVDERVLIANAWYQQYGAHSVGDLAFGRDGMLYVSAGEGAHFFEIDDGSAQMVSTQYPDPTDPIDLGGSFRSQDLLTPGDPTGLSGSVLRLDPATGAAAPLNPLPGDAARIIAFGLRNPFRIAFRPGTDELWIADPGYSLVEEIDRIADVTDAVVENFGWPCFEGDVTMPAFASKPLCDQLIHGTLPAGTPGVLSAPVHVYRHGEAPGGDELVDPCYAGGHSAVVGLAFYRGTRYPARLRDALFFGDFPIGCVYAMLPDAAGVPDPSRIEVFARGVDQAVAFESGIDGDLYYVSLGGSLHHLEYRVPSDPNRAPAWAASTDEAVAEPAPPSAGGCSSTSGAGGWPFLLVLAILRIRRRIFLLTQS
jgi:uncharacterized protein (TIGR03382 family)